MYNMYQPYQQYPQYGGYQNMIPQQQQSAQLPPQQIVQVNGKSSVDTIQLAPNSSILVMDKSAPIVWLCVSDGVGKVTATAYDISEHKDAPPIDTVSIEKRLTVIESTLAEMEGKLNAESNAGRTNEGKNVAEYRTD